MQKFLRLEFIAASPDLGLLLLRLCLGVSMLLLHGWGKLAAHGANHSLFSLGGFPDPLHIGQTPSLLLTILAEVGCSVLLVLGLYTRMAAFLLAFTMGVAFFLVNSMQLLNNPGGELAWLYFGGYLVLFCAGAGKFSLDRK
ncbi:MAG: DoxX family protein [Lacunisphaera sp.]|nr:DoxX family protein [Lacunisphaera sp.]